MGANDLTKVKFSSQADPQILDELKAIAKADGRQLQALMEDAFRDFVAKRRANQMRPAVQAALERTLRERDWLYQQLAK
jgi:predicted transcriptional regulator